MRYYKHIPFPKLRKMYRKESEHKEMIKSVAIGLVWILVIVRFLLLGTN